MRMGYLTLRERLELGERRGADFLPVQAGEQSRAYFRRSETSNHEDREQGGCQAPESQMKLMVGLKHAVSPLKRLL